MRQGVRSVTATLTFLVSLLAAALLFSAPASADPTPPVCEPTIIEGSEQGAPAEGEIEGTGCADLIVAGEATEEIVAGPGDDVVIGAVDVAMLDGGAGEDTIYANGSDRVSGGADDDLIFGDGVPVLGTAEADSLEESLMPFVEEFGVDAVEEVVAGAVGPTAAQASSAGGGGEGQTVFVSHTIMAATVIPGNHQANEISGGSGNDEIYGKGGNDRLFGNIGDDLVWGDADDDLVSGGQGADELGGGDGSDMLRGDGTADKLYDNGNGPSDEDTLSFAGGVTPGFDRQVDGPGGVPASYQNFPGEEGERGVFIDLANRIANNGVAEDGGGKDVGVPPYLEGFENVIGTPYADFIIGDEGANVIDGGGGPDVIRGEGGADTIYGNAGHDNLQGSNGADTVNGGPGADFCDSEGESSCDESGTAFDAVIARDSSKVAVGMMTRPAVDHKDFYLTGSTSDDNVDIFYTDGTGGDPDRVRFELTGSSFDTSEAERTDNCDYSNANANPRRVVCESYDRISVIVVAGLSGSDDLSGPMAGMPEATTYISLGGAGSDVIEGTNTSHDLLVDGPGRDKLYGFGQDDGLINSTGVDELRLGTGNDLALTVSLCESQSLGGVWTGDEIYGTGGEDNASWAQLPDSFNGVAARLTTNTFGQRSPNGPSCPGNIKVGQLDSIENLEGSRMVDGLIGDANDNNLLGWRGNDVLSAGAGADNINARHRDLDPGTEPNWSDDDTIDCGPGLDSGLADRLPLDDPLSQCEDVKRGDPQ